MRANPGEVTRIIARFGPYTGIYPWHCHILEHEDHDMMRMYEVLKNPDFDPRLPIEEQCPDEAFAQCFNEMPAATGRGQKQLSRYSPGYKKDS